MVMAGRRCTSLRVPKLTRNLDSGYLPSYIRTNKLHANKLHASPCLLPTTLLRLSSRSRIRSAKLAVRVGRHRYTKQDSPPLTTDVKVNASYGYHSYCLSELMSALKKEKDHTEAFRVTNFTMNTNSLAMVVFIAIKEVNRSIRTRRAA